MHGRHVVHSVVLSLLLAISSLAQSQQSPAQPANQTTITVTATDHDHHPVTGLKSQDFSLSEYGQARPITSVGSGDVPVCVGLLIDRSGSMRGRHAAIASAMEDFVRAGNPGNQYFVVLFSDDALLQEDFTRDAAAIEQAISAADARGGTGFYEAIIASADHLAERKSCEKRVLVLVSDGVDNESKPTLEQTLRTLNEDGNPLVYAIGLPERMTSISAKGKHALQELTTPSGGAAILLGDFGDIRKATRRIAEELRSQYILTYATSNPQPKVSAHATGGKTLLVRINIAREPLVRAKATATPSTPASTSASQTAAPSPTPAAALPVRGTGCISGSVVDQNKKPVAGMNVEAWPTFAGMNVEAWPTFAGSSYPKDSYPQVTTDGKGKFKFPELQAGNYQLYTKNESAGYPPTKDPFYRHGANDWAQATGRCANVVIAVGPKAARLKVSAIDEVTNEPIARFGFSLRSSHGVLVFRWAPPELEVLVPPNTELAISGWSPPRYLRSEPVPFVTTGPDGSQEVTVKLPRRTPASQVRQDD
jgi:Ca-activated chloride channel homolog